MKKRFLSGALAGLLMLLQLSVAATTGAQPKETSEPDREVLTDITIDEHTFEDEIFRNWILDESHLNGIGADGILTQEERSQVKELNVSGLGISSLDGIEVFEALENLDCSYNNLQTLDVSQNVQLKTLNCANNELSALSLENLTKLESLNCKFNELQTLDVSQKEHLRALNAEFNHMEQINLTGDINLEWLSVSYNLLTTLDVSTNTGIKILYAFDNRLTSLDVQTLSNLEYLNVGTNQLKELDLSQNNQFATGSSGFNASNNLLEKIILPTQAGLQIDPSAYAEQDPITGFDRVEWYLDEQLSNKVTETLEAQGQTLYAKRLANDYFIYFSANGGNGTMDVQKAVFNEELSLSSVTFTRTGYQFTGWNTLPKGNGDAYTDQERVQNLSGKYQGGKITLYAQWQPITYTVSFNNGAAEAQGQMDNQSATYNEDLTLTQCAFTLSDKEFAGWADAPDGPVRYANGANVKNLASEQGTTAVLYAVWRTPVEELQKPYLTALEEAFNGYQSTDYTTEDWDTLSGAYQAAETKISEESLEDQMLAHQNEGIAAMKAVLTKAQRVEEIVNGWKNAHNDVLQQLNTAAVQESNATQADTAAQSALDEMTVDNLKQYSTLTKPEDLAAVGSDALNEVQEYTEDLTAYMTVAQWIVNAQADLTRPMQEVTSETVSQYQMLTTQLGELTEKQTAQMDNGVKTRLEERLALAIQKQSAVGELQSIYYAIDQKDYSESSQAALKQALQDGMKALESSETKEQVTQNLQTSSEALRNISPDEEPEEPQEPEDPKELPFTDVSSDAWYYDAVSFAYQNALFAGMSEDSFGADVAMTRAMFITVLHRHAGKPEVQSDESFVDVEPDEWYTDAVAWAKQNGITAGMDETHFAPHENITREQMAVMLYRYEKAPEANTDLSAFRDAHTISDFALDAMKWAVGNQVINGVEKDLLQPGDVATRAQVAQMMMNYLKK